MRRVCVLCAQMKRTSGRPKILKEPSTLNLSIELETKRKLFAMASARGISLSALVVRLVNEADAKKARA